MGLFGSLFKDNKPELRQAIQKVLSMQPALIEAIVLDITKKTKQGIDVFNFYYIGFIPPDWLGKSHNIIYVNNASSTEMIFALNSLYPGANYNAKEDEVSIKIKSNVNDSEIRITLSYRSDHSGKYVSVEAVPSDTYIEKKIKEVKEVNTELCDKPNELCTTITTANGNIFSEEMFINLELGTLAVLDILRARYESETGTELYFDEKSVPNHILSLAKRIEEDLSREEFVYGRPSGNWGRIEVEISVHEFEDKSFEILGLFAEQVIAKGNMEAEDEIVFGKAETKKKVMYSDGEMYNKL